MRLVMRCLMRRTRKTSNYGKQESHCYEIEAFAKMSSMTLMLWSSSNVSGTAICRVCYGRGIREN